MFKKTSPLLLVIIIGLVYGCASSNPYLDDMEGNIMLGNPDGTIESAEKSIEERPGDPIGYYYRGLAYGTIADTLDSTQIMDERTELYEKMVEDFETARMVADTSEAGAPSEVEDIPDIITEFWSISHNLGVEFASNDTLMDAVDNPNEVAAHHLKNATIIQPDSGLSWDVLSQVAYMIEDFDTAIEAKNKYIDLSEELEAEDYTTLAAFYVNNDNIDGAVEALEKGVEAFPDSEEITTSLADAYQQQGNSEKAIETVEELIERDPENAQYRLSLGTQIYQSALKLSDEISENLDEINELEREMQEAEGDEADDLEEQVEELDEENEELLEEYNELADRAIAELEEVTELKSDQPEAYNTLGVIYQNRSAQLFEQRNRPTMSNEEANELDEEAKETLREAMGYYEEAAEIDPENQEYWESLFQVYTTLGMDEEADEAAEKAGIEE